MICYTYKYTLFLMKKHVNNTIYIYTLTIYIYIYDDDDDDDDHQPSKVNHQGSVPLGPLKQARTWRDLMVLSRYARMVMTTQDFTIYCSFTRFCMFLTCDFACILENYPNSVRRQLHNSCFFVATPYAACVSTIINPKKESIWV